YLDKLPGVLRIAATGVFRWVPYRREFLELCLLAVRDLSVIRIPRLVSRNPKSQLRHAINACPSPARGRVGGAWAGRPLVVRQAFALPKLLNWWMGSLLHGNPKSQFRHAKDVCHGPENGRNAAANAKRRGTTGRTGKSVRRVQRVESWQWRA